MDSRAVQFIIFLSWWRLGPVRHTKSFRSWTRFPRYNFRSWTGNLFFVVKTDPRPTPYSSVITRNYSLAFWIGTRTDLQDITRIREEQRQKKSRTFVRLGRSARRSRRGPQRQELQLGCARHLCALRICDLEGIHGDLRAWRPLHFCHSLELKITFKVDVCGAHV